MNLGAVVVAARALVVALAGALISWLWYTDRYPLVVLAVVLLIALAGAANEAGYRALPDHPVRAVYFLEWWLIYPMALAAIAAAIVIIVTIALAAPKDAPKQTEELLGALSTGVTAFITAALISWTEDKEDSTVAQHIKAAFQSKYKRIIPGQPQVPGARYFQPESMGERWVYSDEIGGIEGWGRSARLERARNLVEVMVAGG